MKYLNRAKYEFYGSKKVESAAQELLAKLGQPKKSENVVDLLKQYRQLDRNSCKSIEIKN